MAKKEIIVRMGIGFKIEVDERILESLDEMSSSRDQYWGEELLGALPPHVNIFEDCNVNDCEVEEKGVDY